MTTKKKLAERLPMKMSELVTTIAKIEIAPKQKYLVLEVRHVARLLHASHTHLLHATYTHLLHASSYTHVALKLHSS